MNEKLVKIPKLNFDICFYNFRKRILEKFDLEEYIKLSYTSELEKYYIRATIWKIYFNILPRNNDLFEWIDKTIKQREYYYETRKEMKRIKKFNYDPLNLSSKNGWNFIYDNKELKKIIDLDIARTFQEFELFNCSKIKELLFNVLYVWSFINSEISYRQGMNELVAVILMAIYPYYIEKEKINLIYIENLLNKKEIIKRLEDEGLNSINQLSDNLVKSIYIFLFHEEELEADLFSLFNQFMIRGMKDIYFVPDLDMPPLNRNLTKVILHLIHL